MQLCRMDSTLFFRRHRLQEAETTTNHVNEANNHGHVFVVIANIGADSDPCTTCMFLLGNRNGSDSFPGEVVE